MPGLPGSSASRRAARRAPRALLALFGLLFAPLVPSRPALSRSSAFSSRRCSFSALRSSRFRAFLRLAPDRRSSRALAFSGGVLALLGLLRRRSLLPASRSGFSPAGGLPGFGGSCGGLGGSGGGRRRRRRWRWRRRRSGPPRDGRIEPPPGRSGPPPDEPSPEEPDEAVSPRTPPEGDAGDAGGGCGESGAASVVTRVGGARASATTSPACAVPRSGAGRLSSGRSPGSTIGASASSVMTTLSATVQSACVPRRLPTLVPSADLPSDLNGSPRSSALEPLKRPGFPAELPRSPAPGPRARPAACGSSGCC